MIWGAIKKLLNSSIGSEDALPLDKMIDIQREFVDAGDMETLANVINKFEKNNYSFIMLQNGTILISLFVKAETADDAKITIYKNADIVQRYSFSTNISVINTEMRLEVKKGDIIKFEIENKEHITNISSSNNRLVEIKAATVSHYGLREVRG